MGKKKKQKGASQKITSAPVEPPVKEQPVDKKKKKKKQRVPQKMERPNWVLTGLAGAGMLLTAYLILTSLLGQPPLYCTEGKLM